MTGKLFLDSNIIIYYFDSEDPTKKLKVHNILSKKKDHQIVISSQVAKEVAYVLISKYGMDEFDVKRTLDILKTYEYLDTDLNIIHKALNLKKINRFSFWDSMILAAALKANCNYLITEDLNHGQIIEGLEIFNPFL